MEIGERVLVPRGMFPDEYVEMRCCGAYEKHTVAAVLFQLLEIAAHQPAAIDPRVSARSCLIRLLPSEEAHIAHEILPAKQAGTHTSEIFQTMIHLAAPLIQQFAIHPNDSRGFEALCVAGGFSLRNLYFGGQMNSKANAVEVQMGQKAGTLFLLYTAYTQDSFIDLPCEHFDLKYVYYRKMRTIVANQAICESDLERFNVLSDCCRADVKTTVFGCCFPGSQRSLKQQVSAQSCPSCHKAVTSVYPLLCKCGKSCFSCNVKSYLTADYNVTVCCRSPLADIDVVQRKEALLASNPHLAPLLASLKHDKKVANMQQLIRKCANCNRQFVDNFRGGESICSACAAKREAARKTQLHPRSTSSMRNRDSKKEQEVRLAMELREKASRARSPEFGGKGRREEAEDRRNMESSRKEQGIRAATAMSEKANRPKAQMVEEIGGGEAAENRGNKDGNRQQPIVATKYPSKGDSQVPLSGSQPGTRQGQIPSQALSLSANPTMKSRSIQRAAPPELPPRQVNPVVAPDEFDYTSEEAKVGNLPGKSVQLVAASRRLPTTPTPPQKHACKTCGMQFSSEDEHIFCENCCECTSCCIEFIFKMKGQKCKWCHMRFDSHLIDIIRTRMELCHVCEIVVPIEEIESAARCKVCKRCVRLQKKTGIFWTHKIVGVCSLCKVYEFSVNETNYLKLQAEKVLWGCCSKGNSIDRRLPCKHFVCQAHWNVLRQCRACGYRLPSP